MSKPAFIVCFGLTLLGVSAAIRAQQASPSPLTGSITLGLRSVDPSGTMSKYREDVNLDDGVRLFDAVLSFRPVSGAMPVDEILFTAQNLGGDPFESMHFSVRKYGAYNLRLDHRRSEYFYADTILPAALASVTGSTAGDLHHFDFERVRDTAALDIDLSPATRINFGLERQMRQGKSTTTLDLQRDEFELDRPLDESLDVLDFGIEHDWQRATLVFEEELGRFENTSELLLPGASPGQDLANPAELQFFFLDQAYDYTSRSHLLRAVADPTDRIDLSAMWRRQDLELDSSATEQSLGTAFDGTPVATNPGGPGRVDRNVEQLGLDLGYRLGDRTRIIAGTQSSRLDQGGLQSFGPDTGLGRWSIETDGLELGAEISIGSNTLLAGGWSVESRDTDFDQSLNGAGTIENSSTDRDGFFARLLHRTDSGLEVTAGIEDNSIDDPFTLSSATDSRRYRLGARYSWDSGLGLHGSLKRTDVGNDASGWAADTEQADLRLTYSRSGLTISAGHSEIDIDREINQLVTGGSLQIVFPIAYAADAVLRDLSARWDLGPRVALGGRLMRYDNRGSFAVERDDFRAFAELALTGDYTMEVSYRDIGYSEVAFDAYDVRILELALRLDW